MNGSDYSNQAEAETERARGERERSRRQGRGKARGTFLYPALPPKPLEMVATLVIYTGKRHRGACRSLRGMVKVHPPFTARDVPGFQFRLLDLRRVPEKMLVSCEKNSRSVIRYEVIAKLSSQPPSRRGAMASSLKLSVVTTLRFRSSPSLAAFWRLGGSFAITSHLKAHDDKEALRELLKSDRDFRRVLVDTARVIQAVTGAKFKIPKNKGVMDMCKAERELCREAAKIAEARGEARGKKQGIMVYVARLMRLGVSKENIAKALAEDYSLPLAEALAHLP